MRLVLLLFTLCLSGFSSLPNQARSQATVQASPQLLVQIALQQGDYDTARAILEEVGATGLDKAYLEGLILQRQGEHLSASRVFRDLLRLFPQERNIRRSLIVSQVAMEDFDGALFQADELIETARSPQERQGYQRLKRQILARRPYGFNAGFSLVPSNNINRATSNDEIEGGVFDGAEITENNESGLGMTVSLGAFRRFPLGDKSFLQLDGSLGITAYSNPDYNRGTAGISLSHTRDMQNGLWRNQLSLRRTIVNQGPDPEEDRDNSRNVSLSTLRQIQIGEKNQLTGSLTASRTDFEEPGNASFDNYSLSGSVGLRRRLTPTLAIDGGLSLSRSVAEDSSFSYKSYRLNTGVTKVWQSGWRASLGLSFEERLYDFNYSDADPFQLRRADETIGANISLLNSRITVRGATPRLSCQASKGSSNIVFADNRNIYECNFSLTTRF